MTGPRAGSPGTAGSCYRAPSPLLILARSASLARSSAYDLGLPGPPGRLWQYVLDEHTLRGRDRVRVHRGHLFYEHPRSDRIEEYLRIIAFRGEDRVQWVRTRSDLLVSAAIAEGMTLEAVTSSFVNTPPSAALARDILADIREALRLVTTQLVVHADDLERVTAAVEQQLAEGPPVEVTSSPLVPPRTAYAFPPQARPLVFRLPHGDLQPTAPNYPRGNTPR